MGEPRQQYMSLIKRKPYVVKQRRIEETVEEVLPLVEEVPIIVEEVLIIEEEPRETVAESFPWSISVQSIIFMAAQQYSLLLGGTKELQDLVSGFNLELDQTSPRYQDLLKEIEKEFQKDK